MHTIDRAVLAAVAPPFVVAWGSMVGLVLLFQARRWADLALGAGLRPEDPVIVLALLVPGVSVIAMPLGLAVGQLVGLGRLVSTHQLDALEAAGVSPLRAARAPLAFALVVSFKGMLIAHLAAPAAMRRLDRELGDILGRNATFALSPGRIVQHGDWAIHRSDTGVHLVYARDERVLALTAARVEGRLDERGLFQLVLEDGALMSLSTAFRVARFSRARFSAPQGEELLARRGRLVGALPSMSSSELLFEGRARADRTGRRMLRDLYRRSALPLAAFALSVAVLALVERCSRRRPELAFVGLLAAVLLHYAVGRVADDLVDRGAGPIAFLVQAPNIAVIALGLAVSGLRRAPVPLVRGAPLRPRIERAP